jgi:hypothetical protein
LPHAHVVDAVTGSNWEGVGVFPDVVCPADEALGTALASAANSGRRGEDVDGREGFP